MRASTDVIISDAAQQAGANFKTHTTSIPSMGWGEPGCIGYYNSPVVPAGCRVEYGKQTGFCGRVIAFVVAENEDASPIMSAKNCEPYSGEIPAHIEV